MSTLGEQSHRLCDSLDEYLRLIRCCKTAAQRFAMDDPPARVQLYTSKYAGSVYAKRLDTGELWVVFPKRHRSLRYPHNQAFMEDVDDVLEQLGGEPSVTRQVELQSAPTLRLNTMEIKAEVIEAPKFWWQWRPWRTYHRDWVVRASVGYGGVLETVQTQPAADPPQPESVVDATAKAIFAAMRQHE